MNPNHPFTPEEIIILASLEEAVQHPDRINTGYGFLGKEYFVWQFTWGNTDQGSYFWDQQELRFQKHNYKIARR